MFLIGDIADLGTVEAKSCAKISSNYEVDKSDLLFFCLKAVRNSGDRDGIARLVVPETLMQNFLHHYHASLEGGHQGVGRTYQRIRSRFHWRGLYRSVQRYVSECTDCKTGKGRPIISGESPGNLKATYPFQIIAMDHVPLLPKSFNGNTELLIWVDLFSGYVVAKASSSERLKRSRRITKSVFFDVSVQVSNTARSSAWIYVRFFSCIQPDHRAETKSDYGIPPLSKWDCRTHGSDVDPGFANVRL